MLACPLFREFREPNKTAKLKGTNINCRPKIGRNYYSISNCMVFIRQNIGAKKILHAKWPTFRAAILKGFTVFSSLSESPSCNRRYIAGGIFPHISFHSFICTVTRATYTAKMCMHCFCLCLSCTSGTILIINNNKAVHATLTVALYNWTIKHYYTAKTR